jgi:glutathione S-transferase
MHLFYVAGSPYARMVRVALIETGLAGRVTQTEVTLRDPASALLPYNPVGRVPSLRLEDGTVLSESLLILAFLDTLLDQPCLMPRAPARLGAMGRAMGMLDGIAVWNRALRLPMEQRVPAILALEETRANRVADTLERDVAGGAYGGEVDGAALALGCALGYCERRHTVWNWRANRPALAAWFDRIAARPSFQATVPPPSGI